MTPEQIAEEIIPNRWHDSPMLALIGSEGQLAQRLREKIADAIRAAAVDDALRAETARKMHELLAMGVIFARVSEAAASLDRLAFILGLSPTERAFIEDAKNGDAPASWLIFADWLDEQNKPAEALRMRTLFPQPGQVAVLTFPQPRSPDHAHIYRGLAGEFAKQFGCEAIVVYQGDTIEMIDEADMRRAGWMRISKTEAEPIVIRDPPSSNH